MRLDNSGGAEEHLLDVPIPPRRDHTTDQMTLHIVGVIEGDVAVVRVIAHRDQSPAARTDRFRRVASQEPVQYVDAVDVVFLDIVAEILTPLVPFLHDLQLRFRRGGAYRALPGQLVLHPVGMTHDELPDTV